MVGGAPSWADGPRIDTAVPERSAAAVAAEIDTDATVAVSGFGSVGYPKAVPLALAADDRDLSLTVISAGSVGDEIDVDLVEADAIARRFAYQARSPIRDAVNDGRIPMADRHVVGIARDVLTGRLPRPDVAVIEAVAVGPDWLVPSTSIGQTPAFVEAADRLVVEVNTSQPRGLGAVHDVYRPALPPDRDPIPLTRPGERLGTAAVRFDPDALLGVVETDRRDSPYEFRSPTDADRAIATNLAGFLEDELPRNPIFSDALNLQFGVGSLGNALMGAFADVDFGDRRVAYFGEVIQDGLLDLLDAGTLEAASATSLALSADGQDRFFSNIDTYADDVVLRPADVSNAAELVERLGVFGVNSALEVDLYGHVNSTNVAGSRMINGIGGSADFNRHAAVSVVALPSTAGGGDVSRVVPMAPHVDHTEHDIDIVVTEHGLADLRARSPRERAQAVLENCAHPDFRPALRAYLDRATDTGGHEPHELTTAFSWDAE
ncbi:MAG: acetyl-CoA hydrolase/transferase C-terminal domain-containing protein [Salinirussus sp.]